MFISGPHTVLSDARPPTRPPLGQKGIRTWTFRGWQVWSVPTPGRRYRTRKRRPTDGSPPIIRSGFRGPQLAPLPLASAGGPGWTCPCGKEAKGICEARHHLPCGSFDLRLSASPVPAYLGILELKCPALTPWLGEGKEEARARARWDVDVAWRLWGMVVGLLGLGHGVGGLRLGGRVELGGGGGGGGRWRDGLLPVGDVGRRLTGGRGGAVRGVEMLGWWGCRAEHLAWLLGWLGWGGTVRSRC